MDYAVQMLNVSKKFSNFYANKNITLEVKKGEIHALLGENGAGKSTLMNILFGFYDLDSGQIKINGKVVKITNPNVANDLGIGMVHQHFKLVDTFTVAQNVVLGKEAKKFKIFNDKIKAQNDVQKIIDQYNFNLSSKDVINKLTVGQEQKVEILKMLYKNNDILIFDEPTGALTPQETDELLESMIDLKKQGKTIILITHKLREIKQVADRCTVIRKGKSVASFNVNEVSEDEMAELMVGRKVNFNIVKPNVKTTKKILEVNNLNIFDKKKIHRVKDITLDVKGGEILGIAGIDGNGQTEFVEAIVGLQEVTSGKIFVNDVDITKKTIRERNKIISYIPQDRQKHGLVLDFSVAKNSVLKQYYEVPYSKNGVINNKNINQRANSLINDYDVRTPMGVQTLARDLSGGNQQKLIIGREISLNNDLLIAVQPTRGVDVGAIEAIHKQLLNVRSQLKAVLLVSLELDEILKMSDRIAVFYNGSLVSIVDAKNTNEHEIGLLMAGKVKNV